MIILALIVIHVGFYVRTFLLFFFSPSFSCEENGNKNGIFSGQRPKSRKEGVEVLNQLTSKNTVKHIIHLERS